MITPERIDVVLRNFEKVLPLAEESGEGHLDMDEEVVDDGHHSCGTVHCAAGWYALAFKGTPRWERAHAKSEGHISYDYGGDWMAEDLGFSRDDWPSTWASENPEIWGNTMGIYMFNDSRAYGDGEETEAESLRDIYDHWTRVRGRLAKEGEGNL